MLRGHFLSLLYHFFCFDVLNSGAALDHKDEGHILRWSNSELYVYTLSNLETEFEQAMCHIKNYQLFMGGGELRASYITILFVFDFP